MKTPQPTQLENEMNSRIALIEGRDLPALSLAIRNLQKQVDVMNKIITNQSKSLVILTTVIASK